MSSSDESPTAGRAGEDPAPGPSISRQSHRSENDDIAANMNENGVPSDTETDLETDSTNDDAPGDSGSSAESDPLSGTVYGDDAFDEPSGTDAVAGPDEPKDAPRDTPKDEAEVPDADATRRDLTVPATSVTPPAAPPSIVPPVPDETEEPAAAAGGGSGRPPGKRRGRAARYGRRALFGLLAFIGLCLAAFGVAYLMTPVPSPQEEAIAQGPTFYYSDGKTVIAKTGVNRDAVPIDEIPKGVRDAVIAAENRSFYRDPGVSVRGTTRALWSTLTGEQLQGGSTITQQMVRNYYGGIGKERSVDRKLKEIMVALKVGREKDKDWILEQYLNTIFFGRDAYGVQAAARAYYGKDVKELTAREGAYLAAAIQQPSRFADPTGPNRAMAEQRWRAVLANMVKDGAISQAEASAMTFPMPAKQKITNILKGQKGYMVNVAKKELIERRGYSEDEINRSGLKIITTFDKRLMDAARKAVLANSPDGMSKRIRTGLVSVDPKTGQVLAFYGGRDYLTEALSSSFGDWAQAGSGFKPIVLAAALNDGMKLYDSVNGSSPQYYNGARVENDGGRSYGYVSLVEATRNSVNTAYVNLGREIGLDKVTKMAEKMGIPESQLTANGANTAPTFPLGVISIHPVQQAGVYATFAAEGEYHTPYVVKSVTNNEDHRRTFSEPGKRAFSQEVARDATYAMEQVVRSGTGTAARLPDGRDVAGKTGTTDEGRAIWFNGFVPQLATSVSMFRSDSKPLRIPGYGVYGGVLPARIWHDYMTEVVTIKGYPPESFGAPSVNTGGDYFGRPSDTPGDERPDELNPTRPPDSEEPEEPSDPPTDEDPGLPLPTPGRPDDPDDGGGGDDEPGGVGRPGGPRPNVF